MVIILDGGMLFELNKKYKDVGEYAMLYDKNLVRYIHQEYINIGCEYITTSNYGFKPNRQKNWDVLTEISCKILKSLKDNNNFTLLLVLTPSK